MRRYANRRDSNEPVLIEVARRIGATVYPLNDPHCGDLLIGYRGVNYLVEVKTRRGKLREGQREFQDHWQGQYHVIRTEEELISLLTNVPE